MKKSTKWIATVATAAAIFFAGSLKAQTTDKSPWRLGIGLEGGIPTGGATSTSNFELGGTLRLQYDVGTHFAWTLTSGYYNFFGKDYTVSNGATAGTVKAPSFGIVPLKVGIKAFFSSNLYFGAEAGAGFETNSGGSTQLILAPTLGFANKTWDIGARYENFSGSNATFGIVGLRVAYAFPL
jgi:hypothetical protein